MKDHRHTTRFDTDYAVTIKTSRAVIHSGKVKNLSIKGLHVILDAPVVFEGEISFSIMLSQVGEGIRIKGKGIVVWHSGHELGISLRQVDSESLAHLRRLVELNIGDPKQAFHETIEWLKIEDQPED